jgi:myosin heavy subunit
MRKSVGGATSSLPALKKAVNDIRTEVRQKKLAGTDSDRENLSSRASSKEGRGKELASTVPAGGQAVAAWGGRPKDVPSPRLTVATLKHVKVQLDALKEEHAKVLERNEALEDENKEQAAEIERLKALLAERSVPTEEEKSRENELENLNAKLEGALAEKEASLARLREELEARGAPPSPKSDELDRLKAEIARLKREAADTARQRDRALELLSVNREELKQALAQVQKLASVGQRLREGALADAIRKKVTMHYLGPRATLMGAEGKQIVFAPDGPTRDAITRFVKQDVVPRFSAMFCTLDGMDEAPDGTSLREYADGVVEYLATGVKKFIDENSATNTGLK